MLGKLQKGIIESISRGILLWNFPYGIPEEDSEEILAENPAKKSCKFPE